jgi:hypothetical protein
MNINKLFAVLVPLLVIASCGGGGGGNGGSDYTAPLQNVAPVINNSVTNYSVEENQSSGFSVNASDADGDPLSYSISGTDASNMSISATGVVTFNTAPDFESPTDTDLDNIYSLSVSVSDGILSTSKDFTVTVTNDVTDDVISVSFNGVVIRSGYVQSANVCVEVTEGSGCSGSSSTSTTNSDGTFNLTQDYSGALVANDGFDVVTNQSFSSSSNMYLSNPSSDGTNVISQLSTLMHFNDNFDSATAQAKLGISDTYNIASTDPFSNLANPINENVARINTQLQILENAMQSLEPDQENSSPELLSNYKIAQAIANRSSNETTLGDTTFIRKLLGDWSFSSFTLSNTVWENLSAAISSYLQKVYADSDTSAHAYFSEVARSELNPLLEKIKNETITESELNELIFSTLTLIDRADSASFTYSDNEENLSRTNYSISNVGSDYYTVDSVNADTTELVIYAKVGDVIVFDPSSSSVFLNHPFELSTTQNDTSGVNNIGLNEGWDDATSTLTVSSSTPLTLYPHCGVHAGMYTQGRIEIVESFDSSKIDVTNSTSNMQVKGTVSKGPYKGASGFTQKVYLREADAGDNFHTHEFNEYPGLTFYMTADQGYHGASSMASDTMFKPKSHFSQESSSEGDGGTGY